MEVEEKYKKAMVSNAQLDNDKGNLIYQVDTLKDVIEEMEEQMSEMKRELEDKSKVTNYSREKLHFFGCREITDYKVKIDFFFCLLQELERQKHTCTVLQHKQEELKEGIRQRDELIEVRLFISSSKPLQGQRMILQQFQQSTGDSRLHWSVHQSIRGPHSYLLSIQREQLT